MMYRNFEARALSINLDNYSHYSSIGRNADTVPYEKYEDAPKFYWSTRESFLKENPEIVDDARYRGIFGELGKLAYDDAAWSDTEMGDFWNNPYVMAAINGWDVKVYTTAYNSTVEYHGAGNKYIMHPQREIYVFENYSDRYPNGTPV